MLVELFIIILALIVVGGIVFLIQMYVLTDAPNVSSAELSRVSRNAKQINPSVIPYSEEMRGMQKMNGELPPCYGVSIDAVNIYKIIAGYKKTVVYKNFLDVMSVLLCQKQNGCGKDSFLKDRRMQILGAANPNDATAAQQVDALIDSFDPKTVIGQFLIASVHLLNRHMSSIQSDTEITAQDKERIQGHLLSFLSSNIPDMYAACT
jgi:hypothetical protein